MAPYQYRPFEDRFSGTIADLMARRGDIAARGAERVGDIQAQGARQQGALVGGTIASIGRDIAAIPAQQQKAKADALQLQGQQLQVSALQRQSDDLKALDVAYTQPGGRDAVLNSLPGHLRPQVAAAFEASDKAHAESQKLHDEADKLATESIADLGATVRDYGYEPKAAQLAISDFKLKYANDPQRLQQIQQVEARLHADPTPETVKALVDPLIALSPKRREEAAKAAELAQKTTNEGQIRLDTQARDAATAANTERQRVETERHNKELERIGNLTAGRTEAAQKETQRHDLAMEAHAAASGSKDQNKLEQEYRTVLARGLSSRSGGLGLEDAKVQQANHLLALMDQNKDPKTGAYNIPQVQYQELALGMAKLLSGTGAVGEGMKNDLVQATASGDLKKVATYLTGKPFNGSTQDVFKMLRDSIERQGQVAMENREGEMRYLRGLAPTELDEKRRTQLEKTSLNPLRQTRTIQNQQTGERRTQVSIDGGETWK